MIFLCKTFSVQASRDAIPPPSVKAVPKIYRRTRTVSGLARPQTPGSAADNPSFQHQDMIVSGIKPTSASTIAGPATNPSSNKLLRPAASMTDDSRYAPSHFI